MQYRTAVMAISAFLVLSLRAEAQNAATATNTGEPKEASSATDADFAEHVKLSLVGEAISEQDAALLADVGLQLADAERVLRRPHAKLPAKMVLEKALKLAVTTHDLATLDRLAKYARQTGDDALSSQISISRKLAGAARATDPALLLSVADTTVEQFALYRRLYQEIKASRLVGDAERISAIEKEINKTDLLNARQKQYLAKQLDAAREATPKEMTAADKILAKLAGQARDNVPEPRSSTEVLVVRNHTGRTQSFQVWFILTRPGGQVVGTKKFNQTKTVGPNQEASWSLNRFQHQIQSTSGRKWIKVRGVDNEGKVRWWGGSQNSLFGMPANQNYFTTDAQNRLRVGGNERYHSVFNLSL